MSSLLKALKQQQSPLVREGSDIDPALIDTGRPSRRMTSMVVLTLLAVLCVLLVMALLQWLNNPRTTSTPHQQPPVVASAYQLGKTLSVANVSWPANVEPQPTMQATGISSETVTPGALGTDSDPRQPLDLNQVSPELLAKFEQAVAQSPLADSEAGVGENSVIPPLQQLAPSFQREVPRFSYDGHMYVSDPQRRWVELNQQRLYRGELFQGLKVVQIEPQRVILSLNGNAFSVDALTDWTGQ